MSYRYSTARLDYRFRHLTGYLDLNNHAFVASMEAGISVSGGDLCYLTSAGKMQKADADAVASSSTLLTLATEDTGVGEVGQFILKGFYTTSGLSPGDILYADTTAGSFTKTFPRGSGDVVRIIGYAISSTQLYFDPDKTWIELA